MRGRVAVMGQDQRVAAVPLPEEALRNPEALLRAVQEVLRVHEQIWEFRIAYENAALPRDPQLVARRLR